MRSLGIDVGVRKGLDVVLLDETPAVLATHRAATLSHLGGLIEAGEPDVVAIDAPPGWARRGTSRQTEREIRLFGIQSYGTPTEDRGLEHPFYEWMRVGFEVFRVAADLGFHRYGAGAIRGTALEVFPHASAVVLAGCLPPRDTRKRAWRASILAAHRVPTQALRSADQIDAALAALTGLLAIRGRCSALGDPTEGVIVLPARTLPGRPYRRCRAAPGRNHQPRLPRMTPCACGEPSCDRLTAREFAPGHDAKRKSLLWKLAREGHEAAEELRRRGWQLPPEIR